MSKDIRSYFFKPEFNSAEEAKPSTSVKKRTRGANDSDDAFLKIKKSKNSPRTIKPKNKKSEVAVPVNKFFANNSVQPKNKIFTPKRSDFEKKTNASLSRRENEEKKDETSFENVENDIDFHAIDDTELISMESEGSVKIERTPRKEVNENLYTEKLENFRAKQSKTSDKKEEEKAVCFIRKALKKLASKEMPKCTPTCLQNLTFVISNVLDLLEKEEAVELIEKCGGRVVSSVSEGTDYIIAGQEPVASKIQKTEDFGTKIITEDELLDLIRNKAVEEDEDWFVQATPMKKSKYYEMRNADKSFKNMQDDINEPSTSKKSEANLTFEPVPKVFNRFNKAEDLEKTYENIKWIDKYKPKSVKQIIGQTGEKSTVKKLMNWLQNWHKYHSTKGSQKPTRPAPWDKEHDGSFFKAVLLSGPPGVGKTTTTHLVCEELKWDLIEFNASDTRSKKLLQEEVSNLLSCRSIRGYCQRSGGSFQRHVLLMDEVDGMSGNEDRGGVQGLIQLIKTTKVPIVCICNDRNHPKMRSLVNYCFDLKFQRPRVQQIVGAMKSICFKEKVDVSSEALEELIAASNCDIRQVLNNLSLLAFEKSSVNLEEAKMRGQQSKKPLNLNLWDATRKVFSASDQTEMTTKQKTDLFFQDYGLEPLFVQENYPRVKSHKAKDRKSLMEFLSKAAESLALGDVIEKKIRSQNAWDLLPLQAIFSSVMPGHYMSGHILGQIQFPVWLGKNSRSNKFDRVLQDLHTSLRTNVSGTKQAINMDYLQHLKNQIVQPLIDKGSEGVKNSLDFMLNYHLTKEKLSYLLELCDWPGFKESFTKIDPKVKAALTRALNKEGQVIVSTKKTSKIKEDVDILHPEEDEENVSDSENDIDSDPMIKVGKPKVKKLLQTKEKKKSSSTKKEKK